MNISATPQAGGRPDDVRNSSKTANSNRQMPKAPGNRFHNLIATNTVIALGSRLGGHKTEIYANGMRVQLKSNTLCYPDVIAVNDPQFTDGNNDVLKNPTAVLEVFSNATDPTDKMQKVESYLALPTVKDCLFVKADEFRVEHYARQNAKQWVYRIYDERDDVISLESVQCKLSLSEIYAQIDVKQELSSKAVN